MNSNVSTHDNLVSLLSLGYRLHLHTAEHEDEEGNAITVMDYIGLVDHFLEQVTTERLADILVDVDDLASDAFELALIKLKYIIEDIDFDSIADVELNQYQAFVRNFILKYIDKDIQIVIDAINILRLTNPYLSHLQHLDDHIDKTNLYRQLGVK